MLVWVSKHLVIESPAEAAAIGLKQAEQLLAVMPGLSHQSLCPKVALQLSFILGLLLTQAGRTQGFNLGATAQGLGHLSCFSLGLSAHSLCQTLESGPVLDTKCRPPQSRGSCSFGFNQIFLPFNQNLCKTAERMERLVSSNFPFCSPLFISSYPSS